MWSCLSCFISCIQFSSTLSLTSSAFPPIPHTNAKSHHVHHINYRHRRHTVQHCTKQMKKVEVEPMKFLPFPSPVYSPLDKAKWDGYLLLLAAGLLCDFLAVGSALAVLYFVEWRFIGIGRYGIWNGVM
jgi:hypothetical protein